MKLTVFLSSLLAAASLNGATITVATQPLDFTSFSPVVNASGGLVADGSGFVAIGVTTLSDVQIGNIGSDYAALTAFQSDFVQFGSSSTFGGAGVFNEPSLFSFGTSASTAGVNPFSGNPILLVVGNGASLAASTELFIYEFGTNYGTDAPLFTADVNTTQAGTVLFGSTEAGIALPNAGTHNGFQMGAVAPVPEPSTTLIGILGVLGLIRRRR